MSKLLAIEASTDACSVALSVGGSVVGRHLEQPRAHAEQLLPMVAELLATAQTKLSALDAIAVGRGPGSFTGVRIGIAVAQGLALGADLPLRPVSTLRTLAATAQRVHQAPLVLALLDARMGEVYCGGFDFTRRSSGVNVLSEQVCKPQQLKLPAGNWFVAGPGWASYGELLDARLAANGAVTGAVIGAAPELLPSATATLLLAETTGDVAPERVEPMYLRNQITRQS